MNVEKVFAMGSNIATCLMCITAVVGVIIAKITLNANHERRRKQATIEFFYHIEREYADALMVIEKKFPKNEVINVCDVKQDNVLLEAIEKYLSFMENMSVGINTNVYDIHVFDRMAGAFAINWFDTLRVIIASFRQDIDSRGLQKTYLYGDFEKLVLNLKEERNKRFPVSECDFAKMKHTSEKNL